MAKNGKNGKGARAVNEPSNAAPKYEILSSGPCAIEGIVPCPDNPRSDSPGLIASVRTLRDAMEGAGWNGDPMMICDLAASPNIADHYRARIAPDAKYMIVSGHRRFAAWTGKGCARNMNPKEGEGPWIEGSDGAPIAGPVYATIVRFESLGEFLDVLAGTTAHTEHDPFALAEQMKRVALAHYSAIVDAEVDAFVNRVAPEGETEEVRKVLADAFYKEVNEKRAAIENGTAYTRISRRKRADLLGLTVNDVTRLEGILSLPEVFRGLFGKGLSLGSVEWVEFAVRKTDPEVHGIIADLIGTMLAEGKGAALIKGAVTVKVGELVEAGFQRIDRDASGKPIGKKGNPEHDKHATIAGSVASGLKAKGEKIVNLGKTVSTFKGEAACEILERTIGAAVKGVLKDKDAKGAADAALREALKAMFTNAGIETAIVLNTPALEFVAKRVKG